jgi:hypothetical protein
MSKDYIPTSDMEYMLWGKNLVAYAEANHERWLVGAPKAIISDTLDVFEARLDVTLNPNCGKLDIARRNEAKRVSVKAMRSYVQGFLARNPLVTMDDREAMRLTVADTVATPAGDPTGMATANVLYPGATQLMLHIKHVEGTGHDPKANYGCRIYYGVYDRDDTPPATGKDLRQSRFTRSKKELFLFEPEDAAKTAWFCIRYENSKGRPGPWGRMFSAVIP